ATQIQSALEHGPGAIQIVVTHVQKTEPETHARQARCVVDLLCDSQPLFADAKRLRELAELTQTPRQALTAGHGREGRKDRQAEPLPDALADELDVPPQDDGRRPVVPRHVERVAQEQVHADLVRDIRARIQGQRALSGPFGKCSSASSACSKKAVASRLAERSSAFTPAWRW